MWFTGSRCCFVTMLMAVWVRMPTLSRLKGRNFIIIYT